MDDAAPLTAPVEAIDVLAGLLSEADAGPADEFWSRLAAATCRLAQMRRAVLFVYDDERRSVRAVGSHGIDLRLFADASPTASQVELAYIALSEDRVVEITGHAERELPEEFHPLLLDGTFTCTPMAAGGRWVGVIVADRPREAGELTDAQRHSLWTLGKLAGLVAGTRYASNQHERARRLDERIRLTRELHDQVVQRLFGVSLALAGDGPLDPAVRRRCAEEVGAALGDLRAALQRPSTPRRPTTTTLLDEVERLRRARDDVRLEIRMPEGFGVPPALDQVGQSVLREAVRNAFKHAEPSFVEIHLDTADDTFLLEVVNDGVDRGRARSTASGMGLRLAAFEALEHGGIVEFGAVAPDRWRVRLTVPLEAGS